MTKEPPKGLRANLRSTYVKMDDDKLKRTCKPEDFRKMLFGELPYEEDFYFCSYEVKYHVVACPPLRPCRFCTLVVEYYGACLGTRAVPEYDAVDPCPLRTSRP